MKRIWLALILCNIWVMTCAQTVSEKTNSAVQSLLKDEQMKHALMALYIVETKTGRPVYALNEETGVAPASTQKVITSTAALSLLSENYQYSTEVFYDGNIEQGILNGSLHIVGHGDPTLGSWRFKGRKENDFIDTVIATLKAKGVKSVSGGIYCHNGDFETQTLPGGWIWDDIGNYYGAGIAALNWHENQYDLYLKPGKNVGDSVGIIKTQPALYNVHLTSEATTGSAGSGDNGFIYLPPYANEGFVRGTVPAGSSTFTISGSIPDPAMCLALFVAEQLRKNNIEVSGAAQVTKSQSPGSSIGQKLLSYYSPSLDSIVYHFLQKSINLYGEALLKTMAYIKDGKGSTEKGIELLQQFWKERGIDKDALNILDGSGLSPQNRVSAKALVSVLQYAKDQSWFKSFYAGLPLYNNMKMKSGSIGGSRAFTGYHTSKQGTQYTFAIVINNYSGSSSAIVQKMYKVLNQIL
ncbi:D-alanyl-D-alanine carboxypeptidase/D-alanyl-D-alanine-endopeptidase [Danxiaibacter flavus]|uniref:D-alanyl-D-alanine carboxypeptidase/D-alanyl-D-alanine-endopeptidase n=1 Tax=Danxiaibacter flavus TaxID=3049108 RepID=A0ABV3ZKT4_9BACT|nr:D-alanyl-D-alanine carboxypeptidase/D-alanyl-D-alanine-endopeptidase [Chitinophagaceae bacterium DXS]